MSLPAEVIALVPPEGLKIGVLLLLCFLIGLEREHRKGTTLHSFGGVRTFPLIGLFGYALSRATAENPLALVGGLFALCTFLLVTFSRKVSASETAGATSEISGLLTFILGALCERGDFWIAAVVAVAAVFLLELKAALEGLSHRIASDEILSFTQFLLLAAVILPAVPDREFTSFLLNPYKTWLVVVAVSAISYASYVLQLLVKGRGGVLAAGLLGGAYSSTVTTIALAKRSREAGRGFLYSGAILMSSGVMYLRLAALLVLFNGPLAALLAPWFLGLAFTALAAGWLWSRRSDARPAAGAEVATPKNPLELDAAFLFAAMFVVVIVVTHLALRHLGRGGLYGLAALMGLSDVDPFILGMAQNAGTSAPLALAAGAITIAAASNNALKGCYALAFAEKRCGRASLGLLLALTALGLLPLLRLY
jgi:uncharacterized membrane protein (DUF4010 family)